MSCEKLIVQRMIDKNDELKNLNFETFMKTFSSGNIIMKNY